MGYPSIPGEVEMLSKYKHKNGLTSAQTAVLMAAFGGKWLEDYVNDLLKGKVKPTSYDKIFIRLFLLDRYYNFNTE